MHRTRAPQRPRPGARHVVLAGLAGTGAFLAVAACSSPRPSVELTQSAGGARSGATVTETRTVGVTETVPVTTTVTITATPTVTVTALPRPALSSSRAFDRTRALAGYAALLADVRALDAAPVSGSAAALRLDAMAAHFEQLGASGSPPGTDAPTYLARLASLRLFADAAAREAEVLSPQAAARYAVVRQETGTLLTLVNGALSTTFTLPEPPAPQASPSTLPVLPTTP